MKEEEIEQYADNVKQIIRLDREYDEINLEGNKGIFRLVKRSKSGTEITEIGSKLKGVVLRIRRQLVQFNRNSDNLWTPEHNFKGDFTILFEGKRIKEKGTASDLREKYQKLKTQQVLYTLIENKIVRIIIKGSSLGSENKPQNSIPFYEYLSTAFDRSIGEHIWKFETIFTPVAEKGPLGNYFAVSFAKGEKLDTTYIEETVGPAMKKLHDQFNLVDQKPNPEQQLEAKDDSQQFPEEKVIDITESLPEENENIKPENIPF